MKRDTQHQASVRKSINEFLVIYPPYVQAAARRLLNARKAWEAGLTAEQFEYAVHIFLLSKEPGPWGRKTKLERAKWFRDFDAAMKKLLGLAKEGPANRKSIKNFTSAMDVFERDVAIGSDVGDYVRKPRDKHSRRAEFIVRFSRQAWNPPASNTLIVAIVHAMFEDEDIDVSKVGLVIRKQVK